MSDDDNTNTILAMMDPDKPEDIKLVLKSQNKRLNSVETRLDDAEESIEAIDTIQKPIRWIFNKISAGVGTAIALLAAGYFTGFFD